MVNSARPRKKKTESCQEVYLPLFQLLHFALTPFCAFPPFYWCYHCPQLYLRIPLFLPFSLSLYLKNTFLAFPLSPLSLSLSLSITMSIHRYTVAVTALALLLLTAARGPYRPVLKPLNASCSQKILSPAASHQIAAVPAASLVCPAAFSLRL